ncbi:hypothetical protein E2562_015588 [Oryza meyeriana var. granulata]|uniref:Uncharacterized protein n=1 Tax=Oryza meyeriana var. granulata TaxID=110450 RepID=A0A6G1EKA0_9ORYZ|nr:hypothetical protein E2562_015588 [Oryza meyeriana var. granulata]
MASTVGLQELRGSQSGKGPPVLMLCIAGILGEDMDLPFLRVKPAMKQHAQFRQNVKFHGTYSAIIALKTNQEDGVPVGFGYAQAYLLRVRGGTFEVLVDEGKLFYLQTH